MRLHAQYGIGINAYRHTSSIEIIDYSRPSRSTSMLSGWVGGNCSLRLSAEKSSRGSDGNAYRDWSNAMSLRV